MGEVEASFVEAARGRGLVIREVVADGQIHRCEVEGKGKEAAGSEGDEGAGRAALELEVLKAADLFQAEGLLKHCLEGFRGALTVHTAK